jgi:hypothetical protein
MTRRSFKDFELAVFDCETDPFALESARANVFPRPFLCGFKSYETYVSFWGSDCIEQMMSWLDAQETRYLIYVHNGGRFDFNFLYDYVEEPVFIIRSNLVEFSQGVKNRKPHHVWRDSLRIIPVALSEFHKTSIDYAKLQKHRRDRYRKEIEAYQRADCEDLFALVKAFVQRFEDEKGNIPITIGQLAMKEFKALHEFVGASESTDEDMRDWYFGGRTQCFAAGVLKGPWVYYDINSSYPYAMKAFWHPTTDDWDEVDKPPMRSPKAWFAEITATNHQALPVKIKDDDGMIKTEFNVPRGRFFACSHELIPAIEAGMVEVERWHRILVPAEHARFSKFVDKWYPEKYRCRERGDKAGEIFSKIILNAAAGKLGQNPRDYQDYALCRDIFGDKELVKRGYEPTHIISNDPWLELYSKPSRVMTYKFNNVGIAASILSAARATMLRGLRDAIEPIYCDTDSVVCRAFNGAVSPSDLGAWKHETWRPTEGAPAVPVVADYAAIAGRKTYCLYNVVKGKIVPIKTSSKGGNLSADQIIDLARGGVIEDVLNEAPTFSIKSDPRYVKRSFRATVSKNVVSFV